MFCNECGVEIKEGAKFCMNCGVSIVQSPRGESSKGEGKAKRARIGNNTVSTLKVIIGGKEEHYLPIFEKIEKGEKPGVTALALIAPLWMLYRKMYQEFFILLAAGLIGIIPIIGTLFSVVVLIYLIFNLRRIYYKSILRKLDKNGLTGVDLEVNPEKLGIVKHLGGTTYKGIVIYILSAIIVGGVVSLGLIVWASAALVTGADTSIQVQEETKGEEIEIEEGQAVETASKEEEQQEVEEVQNKPEEIDQQEEVLVGGQLTPLRCLENMQDNETMPFTIVDHAREFLTKHPEFFYNRNGQAYEDYIDYSLTFRELDKNINRYGEFLIQVSGTVIDIQEMELFSGVYITALQLLDNEYNNYYIFYLGELEDIYSDTEVLLSGLPIGKTSFENIGGGYTRVVLLALVEAKEQEAYYDVEDYYNNEENYSVYDSEKYNDPPSNEYAAVWIRCIHCDTLYTESIWNGVRNYVSLEECPTCGETMYDEILAADTEYTWELFRKIYSQPPYYYIIDIQEGICECGNEYFMTIAAFDDSEPVEGVCIKCGWRP